MAAEVSSAGWRKPVGEEYPAPPLLRRFVDRGVPLTTASDAHTLPDVAERADDLRELLLAAGVDTLRGFRDRQPRTVPIGGPAAGRHVRAVQSPGGLSVATPAELAFERTNLDEDQLAHLQRLLGTWGILADLSFSDLVLHGAHGARRAAIPGRGGSSWSSSGRCARPTAPRWSSTTWWARRSTPTSGRWSCSPSSPASPPGARWCSSSAGEPVRLHCIPVRCEGTTVAVLARLSAGAGRRPGHLERTYRDVFNRFAVMLSECTFPFPSEEVATEEAPRVGDGVVLVDEEGRVRYASPNATNALHRMGMYSQIEGRRLTDLGIEESAIEWALASALPVVEEVERRPDVTVLLHCIPLIQAQDVTGCIVLLRDVTDSAASTGCCSPRTPPSARSTTGSRTTSRPSRPCCGCRPGGCRPAAGGWRCSRPSAGCGPSPSSTRSSPGSPATRCPSTRS